MTPKIEVKNLSKNFGDEIVLNNISFVVEKGEFLSILGSSGCGKTTLLRCLIGLETADSGHIFIDGHDITHASPDARGMGIVFQNYALFPNMTVLENVEYALKKKPSFKNCYKETAIETLKILGMSDHLEKKPRQLSGGQQQRVAIARTVALKPSVLLFDESLSALDVENKEIMKKEMKNIQQHFQSTIIYVTHDQEDAFELSDRILVMLNGNIEQLNTPGEILKNPATDYVKNFIVDHMNNKLQAIQNSMRR